MQNLTMHDDSVKIDFSEMVRSLAKPGADIIASLTPENAHNLHMAVGISGEAGELLDAIYAGSGTPDIIEELGDIEFYMEGLRQMIQVTRVQTIEATRPGPYAFHSPREAAAGVCSGAAALLDAVKKAAIYCKVVDVNMVINAMSDIELHLTAIRHNVGIQRDQTIEANIYKLALGPKARYKSGKYSNEQAQARADKAEGEMAHAALPDCNCLGMPGESGDCKVHNG